MVGNSLYICFVCLFVFLLVARRRVGGPKTPVKKKKKKKNSRLDAAPGCLEWAEDGGALCNRCEFPLPALLAVKAASRHVLDPSLGASGAVGPLEARALDRAHPRDGSPDTFPIRAGLAPGQCAPVPPWARGGAAAWDVFVSDSTGGGRRTASDGGLPRPPRGSRGARKDQ
jgi:hypothetical protein